MRSLIYENYIFLQYELITSTFKSTLDDIRIEKIILAAIWVTKYFIGGFSSATC